MQVLEKISVFVGKHMAVIVLVIAALSLFCPKTALWVQTGWINYLLMLVMFGMGLTLKTEDFKYVFQHPRNILLGCISQFTIMPLLAYGLGMAFQLDTALLAGVILVGTCPGGTSSNVITYLAGGDVALSVGMTSVNTLLAPLLTPAITYLFLHTSVEVDVWSMFLSVVQVVIIPIVLGLLVNRFLGRLTASFAKILPLVSVTAICLIVMAVVSHNAEKILTRCDPAQPARLCLWFRTRKTPAARCAADKSDLCGDRHAELRTCNGTCWNSVSRSCYGYSPGRHLFCVA